MKKKVLVMLITCLFAVLAIANQRKSNSQTLDPGGVNNCTPTPNTECYTWASGDKSCLHGGEEHSLNCE